MLERYRDAGRRAFPEDRGRSWLPATDGGVPVLGRSEGGDLPADERLDDAVGTAVTVQAMVFGNAGGDRAPAWDSPATRLPANAGCMSISASTARARTWWPAGSACRWRARLRRVLPGVYGGTGNVPHAGGAVRRRAGFRVHRAGRRLWLLQTRRAKRTPWAALRIAVDLVEEGLISPAEGTALLDGVDLATVVRTRFAHPGPALARAQVAGVGVASGRIALDSAAAARLAAVGSR